MEGRALQCPQSHIMTHGAAINASSDEYVKALGARFGSHAYDDPLAELQNLRQIGSLHDYLNALDELHPKEKNQ